MSSDTSPATPGPRLRDPANQVSPKARLLWAGAAGFQALVPLIVLAVAGLFDWFHVPVWVWPVYLVLAIAYVVLMPAVRYRIHRWESAETAVYTQTGWLSRERRIAPLTRIQTIDFEQSALGRLLGLASVTVTTASAAGPLVISGIDAHVAESLVGELTRRTEAEKGDAT